MAFHPLSLVSAYFPLLYMAYGWLRAEQWAFCAFLKMCVPSGMYSHSQTLFIMGKLPFYQKGLIKCKLWKRVNSTQGNKSSLKH